LDQAPVGADGSARRLSGAGWVQLVCRCRIRRLADLGRRHAQGRAAPAWRAGLWGVHRPPAAAGSGRFRRCCPWRGGSGGGTYSRGSGHDRNGRAGRRSADHRSTNDGFTSSKCAQYAAAAACLRPGGW